jgi:hypothetical protein
MANIIAAFCAEHEIFWDDVNIPRTTVEMDTFRKSYLGQACWDFECFLSQQTEKKPDKFAAKYAAKHTVAPKKPKATSSSTGSVRGTAPKSDYKTSGAKSGVIKGLIGEPGEKIKFSSGTLLYSILCASSKTKPQFAFIDPISTLADPNPVRLGDPSGYTACKLFFKSMSEAKVAIDTITSKLDIPAHISAMSPARAPADANGYFLVNTEIGPAYIKARKLNETVIEDSEEVLEEKGLINDIDVYTEAFFKE